MHRLCWLAVLVPATCLCAQAPALDYPALLARLQAARLAVAGAERR